MSQTVLSGIQPSGTPHLGNFLGAIRQHIAMQEDYDCYFFQADLHALTTIKDPELLRKYTLELTATYIALGLDPEKSTFFRHSDLPEHSELCWILNCITKVPFIERAHAFKDAKQKGKKEVTVGLFDYPILQAADILLYQPDLVPVGKDQKQHIEMTRDIATNFNNIFGETFKLPEALIKEDVAVVPGTDGEKMSKSYKNTIDILADPKTLKKQVMSIVTDSKELEEPKDPSTCHVFALYKLIAQEQEVKEMAANYKAGGYGYGHAKKELLRVITENFAAAREKYVQILEKPEQIKEILEIGAKKAKIKASQTLGLVKERIGYKL